MNRQQDMIAKATEQRLSELEQRTAQFDHLLEQRDKAFSLVRQAKTKMVAQDHEIQKLRANLSIAHNAPLVDQLKEYIRDLEKEIATIAQYVEKDVREKYDQQIERMRDHMGGANIDVVAKLARLDEFVIALISKFEQVAWPELFEQVKQEYSEI